MSETPNRLALATLLPALLLLAAGCGGEPHMTMEGDALELSKFLDDWNEVRDVPKQMTRMFVEGKAPAAPQLKKYREYSYAFTGTPSAGGETATIPIAMRHERGDGASSTVDWSFRKGSDGWKLESAPLP